jgi:heterodisulfide reductase subunit C
MLSSILFAILLAVAILLFARRIQFVRKAIALGRTADYSDQPAKRWSVMARVALGQGKMTARPVAGIMHILIYIGFVTINIEMLEIVIDGLTGNHRIFHGIPGYDGFIAAFELLAFAVLFACLVFLFRRNVMAIQRFRSKELKGWPSLDANLILIAEVALMFAFLSMNATDAMLQNLNTPGYHEAGAFPISQWIQPLYSGLSQDGLILVERGMWWFHIIGVLMFLVYVTYSKHFHILLAFPNTYFSDLTGSGTMPNMEAVTKEVQLMMDPTADPYAAPAADAAPPLTFGVKDVTDLTWKQLLESYSCTECGRCTSVCPANATGKLLSPRKVMMDVRDRAEELAGIRQKEGDEASGGTELIARITEEELWACTSCQACIEACPILISPMGIILDMRRNLIMEESKSPESLTSMFNNVENNGAPWAFPSANRANWIQE